MTDVSVVVATRDPDLRRQLRDLLEAGGVGTNVMHLVPHNSVRQKVMGNANRAPTDKELKQMEQLVDKGMRDGAWGLATGLIYNPGTYAKTDEIVALDEALTALAEVDPRKVRVVEMRFFAGLSVEEVADVLKVSKETVMRDWRLAKVWLLRELEGEAVARES